MIKFVQRLFPRASYQLVCLICGLVIALLAGLAALTMMSLFPAPAQAQSEALVMVTVEGISKAETAAEAAREITPWASSTTAREHAIEILGDARYQKNKAAVESKIVRQSSKFIPFSNPGEPVKQPDGSWKMPVELRISTASLRKMILEAGLLNDSDGPAAVLPMIAFTDRTKGLSVRWWMGEDRSESSRFLTQLSHTSFDRLQTDFLRQGFYMVKPIGLQKSPLPEALKSERPSQNELAAIGSYFRAPMIARGDVRLMPARNVPGAFAIAIKIQVVQANTGRAIAEVSRQATTEAGTFETVVRTKLASEFSEASKDLSVQLMDAWQRGTLNTNFMKLSVRGVLLPKQVNDFKASFLRSVKEVKELKERGFEKNRVVFEMDYTGDAATFAGRLKTLQMQGFETRLADANPATLTLDVRVR